MKGKEIEQITFKKALDLQTSTDGKQAETTSHLQTKSTFCENERLTQKLEINGRDKSHGEFFPGSESFFIF